MVYNPQKCFSIGPIAFIRKDRIYLSHEKSIEADLFLRGNSLLSSKKQASDFVIEVKYWKRKISLKAVDEFIEKVKLLRGKLKNTGYLIYSQKGFTAPQKDRLQKEKIMYTDAEKLKPFSF